MERKLLSQLMRNYRRSDRELAKAIGTSQPTTTKLRNKLEKEGYIREYTIIPNFSKIGYTIMALNFIKFNSKTTNQEIEGFKEEHADRMGNDPYGIVLIQRGMGRGYDAVVASFQKDYASYDDFTRITRRNMIKDVVEMTSFLINIEDNNTMLPSFSFLSRHMFKSGDKTNK